MSFELLVAADLSVADPDATARDLIDALGLPEPQPSWIVDAPGASKVYFLRTHARRIGAPTYVEVIGPNRDGAFEPWFHAMTERQQARPMKTHAVNFGVPDPLVLAERLRSNGVPYRLMEGGSASFPRLHVGQSIDDPTFYDPRFDAGLMLEVIPTSALALPAHALERVIQDDVVAGGPVRVASRAALVADLDEAVAALERNVGFAPTRWINAPIDGARIAVYEGSIPASAVLELVEPVADGPIADHVREFGPGTHRIAIAVNGLDDAADRLRDKNLAFQRQDDAVHGARLSIDPGAIGGLLFDLVEA